MDVPMSLERCWAARPLVANVTLHPKALARVQTLDVRQQRMTRCELLGAEFADDRFAGVSVDSFVDTPDMSRTLRVRSKSIRSENKRLKNVYARCAK